MATEYIKNGNFADKFEHWKKRNEFEPRFEAYGKGKSIYVPTDCGIEQSIPDLPGKTMRIEFEVRAEKRIEETIFLVWVVGNNADGDVDTGLVLATATQHWKKFSMRLFFKQPLSNCSLAAMDPVVAMPGHQVTSDVDSKYRSLWFANFSLIEEPEA